MAAVTCHGGLIWTWKSLYKPLIKKLADLQWRILHGIMAVNSFISVINAAVEDKCPFCNQRETVFHSFSDCTRLTGLFVLLHSIFNRCGEVFMKQVLLYIRQHTPVLGQAKLAVSVGHRKKVEEDLNVDVVPFFSQNGEVQTAAVI